MYLIRSSEGRAFYFVERRKTYVVGRKECDVLITDDSSISRKHATIVIEDDDTVTLKDLDAKYKTRINDQELEKLGTRRLKVGDVLHFGILRSVYTFEEVRISAACSGLTGDEKAKLAKCLKLLGGDLRSDWFRECTHLTVREIVLTLKVLCALTEGQPIVTLKYWEEFVRNVESNLPPPAVEDHMPVCAETILRRDVSLKYDPKRKVLFKNKVFVFSKAGDRKKMEDLINLAGGRCLTWQETQLTQASFSATNPQHILMQDTRTHVKTPDSFVDMQTYLERTGTRPIPQQEIAMAVVLCSCEKDCNPNFDRSGVLIRQEQEALGLVETQKILAKSTQSQEYFTPEELKSSVVIPETVEDDVFDPSAKPGPVTSTQVDRYDLYSPGKFDFPFPDVSGIKREGERLESETLKRSRSDADGKHPFGFRRLTSALNKIQTDQKSLVISTQTASNLVPSPNLQVVKLESPQPVRKRSCDDEGHVEMPPAKKSQRHANPFTLASKPRPSSRTDSSSDPVFKLPCSRPPSTKRRNSDGFVNVKPSPVLRVTVVDEQMVGDVTWKSRDTTRSARWRDVVDASVEDVENEALLRYVNSFRDCVVVTTLVLDERKWRPAEDLVCGIGAGKNFKKFKKVQPLHVQTTIIPKSEYTVVVCNDTACRADDDDD